MERPEVVPSFVILTQSTGVVNKVLTSRAKYLGSRQIRWETTW